MSISDKSRTPWQRGLELKAAVMPPEALSMLARYGLAIALAVAAPGLGAGIKICARRNWRRDFLFWLPWSAPGME